MYRASVAERFNALQEKIQEQVQRIVRDLQVVVAADGEAPEAVQDPELAEELNSKFEAAQRVVESARDILRELEPH